MVNDKAPVNSCVVGVSLLHILVAFDFSQLCSSALLAVVGTVISYFVSKRLEALFEKELSN
jgi:hypothetical protein